MAFFRKDKTNDDVTSAPYADDSDAADAATPPTDAASDTEDGAAETDAPDAAAAEDVPHVNISVSTYGKPAQTSTPRPPAEAPAPSVEGLAENTLVRHALAALPEKPEPKDILNVMRQALQGQLYLRVNGDAQALLAEGKPLTLAVSNVKDRKFLLAFSGSAALQASVGADSNAQTSAIGQAAAVVLRNVVSGPYDGLVLDHAMKGTNVILPKQLIEKSLQEGDHGTQAKDLLSAPRTEHTAREVAAALAESGGWVAVRGEGQSAGITEVRTGNGTRRVEVFTHPLEVLALGRSDRPARITGDGLGRALRSDEGLNGIVVNPAGPWIEIDREDLTPIFDAADTAADTTADTSASSDDAEAD